jgi:hypothetical protein
MNNFLKIAKEHQEEMKRQEEHIEPSYLEYHEASSRGILKAINVRLPVDIIAKIDFIQTTGFWTSKQHVIYDMICSAVEDFYNDAGEHWGNIMDEAGKQALSSLPVTEKAAGIYDCLVEDGHEQNLIGDREEFIAKFSNLINKQDEVA